MQLHTRHKLNVNFSMSSMTDIVFLLLIFFMLTITSATPQALPIDLPSSDNADAVLPQVNVTITASHKYYIDGKELSRVDVAKHLKKAIGTQKRVILLCIDKSVPVEHMIYVTDIAATLDAQVSVATQPNAHEIQ